MDLVGAAHEAGGPPAPPHPAAEAFEALERLRAEILHARECWAVQLERTAAAARDARLSWEEVDAMAEAARQARLRIDTGNEAYGRRLQELPSDVREAALEALSRSFCF